MKGTVEELIVKLKGLPQFVSDVASQSLDESAEDILDLNKAQMLVLGVDANDDQLGEYSPGYAEERRQRGLQTDYIDLRFTGKFQDKMKLKKVKKLSREITSTDPKWENGEDGSRSLQAQWPDALGLDDDNEERVTKIVGDKIAFDVDNYFETDFRVKVAVRV